MKIKQIKYIIRASYSYFSGTFNAPKNGNLRNEYGNLIQFSDRETAKNHLEKWMHCEENEDGSFSAAGTYHTAHGEHSRPVYRIRKITL